mmetsp:Transcript_102236/g.327829  ORF Transcript_102236/g.327829 Transcript_102236/m.327829 type:complete len:204 (-) Transcript_102236:2243-2854(-)
MVSRSQSGDIGNPSRRSSSPCMKNSVATRLDHSLWIFHGNAEWQMSPPFRHIWARNSLSGAFSKLKSGASRRTRDFEIAEKCSVMSVLRMSSTICPRKATFSAGFSRSSTVPSSSACSAEKHVAACMFSKTLRSLYSTASACWVVTQNALVLPKCFTSWQSAAITKEARSREVCFVERPACFANQLPPWHTCVAWMALWYGFS